MPDKKYRRSTPPNNKQLSIKRKRKNKARAIIIAAVVVVLLAAGAFFFFRYRSYKSYKVTSQIELANTDEQTTITPYNKGYMRCATEGVTYFDKNGIIWAESFEMTQPVFSSCGEYFAVSDMKGKDVYLYNAGGLLNRITVGHAITDVEVSSQGVVAAATSEDESNYIEVVDKTGAELITAKSVFASSGYLTDIALSDDGKKLVAIYVYISEGVLESKAVFYDFTNGESGQDMVVGGFNQYRNTILTNVEFMDNNRVAVVGDNAYTIYNFSKMPEIIDENLSFEFEIQTLFFDSKHIGMVVEDENSESAYQLLVINLSGKQILSQGFDFAYNKAVFAGNNVVLYSFEDLEMFSLFGVKRCSITMEDRIMAICPTGKSAEFVYGAAGDTEFIKLK